MVEIIIAVDPGREKSGVAVVRSTLDVVYKAVVETVRLVEAVQDLVVKHHISIVALGDRTSSREAKKRLEPIICQGNPIRLLLIDEHHSTDQARNRYWQENPPRGFRRLLPVGLQTPPCPVDDYVAVILAERYFQSASHP